MVCTLLVIFGQNGPSCSSWKFKFDEIRNYNFMHVGLLESLFSMLCNILFSGVYRCCIITSQVPLKKFSISELHFATKRKNKTHEILLVWINFQCSIKKSKGSWRIMVIVSVRQWRLSDRAGSTVSSHHDRWGKTFDNKNIIHTCLSYLLFTNSYYRKTNHKQCSRNNHSKTQRLVAKFFGKIRWVFLTIYF